jgi:2-polyprenyl-6-methoxyphenol hydroxylase-like FAD-dependent oxidoreductase
MSTLTPTSTPISTQGRTRRALVIGGGIAGTVAAIALRKAGLEAVIAEAHDASADGVGAFLTLVPNGVRGLRLLELDGPVLAAGFETPRFAIWLGDGRQLTEMSAGDSGSDTTRTIRRADLYSALRREAEARGIRVEYGKRLEAAGRAPGGGGEGVVARFTDGSELEADLLVGADGIHSRLRTLLDPRASGLRYLGLLNTGGFSRAVPVPGRQGTVNFVFGKRCFFGWARHPDGGVWWFANPGHDGEPSAARLAELTPDRWRAQLVELFAEDDSPALPVLEATDAIIGPWPTHDLPRVKVWQRDRMVLIGDAAHAASPSSGQGASMAIEDGIVLARCLRDAAGIEPGLVAYERARRGRVEKIVAQGRRNGTGKTPGPFGRKVRDLILRMVFSRARAGHDPLAWIHDHRIEWEGPMAAG